MFYQAIKPKTKGFHQKFLIIRHMERMEKEMKSKNTFIEKVEIVEISLMINILSKKDQNQQKMTSEVIEDKNFYI